MAIFVFLSALAWLGLWCVPWKPWSARESIEPADATEAAQAPRLAVLIPARDEAGVIGPTLRALRGQGGGLRVIVIDDQSRDGTAALAARLWPSEELVVVSGEPLPEGWSGKLWALEQGWRVARAAQPEEVLLLDADIELAPGMAAALAGKLRREGLDLVSVMAALRMESFWEKALVPAFVYFFKLIYPFALSNDPRSGCAAAAGGCILLRAGMLERLGGFDSIRGALIDDCTLARKVKEAGGKTWIGLSHSVCSHRPYPDLGGIWNMVARNAFTQLRYSRALLLATTALLVLVFWAPVFGLLAPAAATRAAAAAAFIAMAAAYAPTLLYYRRSVAWALGLPVIGALFLFMTWTSAWRYWRGKRSEWKGRVYSAKRG
jgi:hopene-associated glycosyltransferase HpnB